MSIDYRHKMIMDPVHGDIGLSELETKIIDTPAFQRLRRLKQLGFASLVYPNASYSRFAHSLGVLHIASRVAEVFERKKLIDEDAVKKLRIAALLHDIGHYPYSHLMEYIEWEQPSERFLQKEGSEAKPTSVSDNYPPHEELGKLIVSQRKDIAGLLEKEGIDTNEIGALIKGEHPDIPNILHKSLDVDRLDYLVRDSLNTGLPYGRVDLNYILNNLVIADGKEIVLKNKARLSAEHLLLARYFMFNAVYLHKTIFGFEELVRKTLLLFMKKKEIYTSGSEIEKMVTTDSGEYLNFHDGYLDIKFDSWAIENSDDLISIFCRAIKHRHPPKLVHEVVDLQHRDGGNPRKEYILFRTFLQNRLKECSKECEIEPQFLFWREPKDIHFEAVMPFVSLSQLKDLQEGELRELIRLIDSDGNIKNLIEEKSSIIYHLSQLQAKSIRLYAVNTADEQLKKLKEKIKKFIGSG